jgi:hypothetical protein
VLLPLLLLLLQVGFRHSGFLLPGGNLVMKVYEVRGCDNCCERDFLILQHHAMLQFGGSSRDKATSLKSQ